MGSVCGAPLLVGCENAFCLIASRFWIRIVFSWLLTVSAFTVPDRDSESCVALEGGNGEGWASEVARSWAGWGFDRKTGDLVWLIAVS